MKKENLKIHNRNKGLFSERTKFKGYPPKKSYINKEKIMQQKWNKENHPKENISLNHGYGLLQDLFIAPEKYDTSKLPMVDNIQHLTRDAGFAKVIYKITPREHIIAATLMQWLGSPMGFCFIQEFIEECGYEIKLKGSATCVKAYSTQGKAQASLREG